MTEICSCFFFLHVTEADTQVEHNKMSINVIVQFGGSSSRNSRMKTQFHTMWFTRTKCHCAWHSTWCPYNGARSTFVMNKVDIICPTSKNAPHNGNMIMWCDGISRELAFEKVVEWKRRGRGAVSSKSTHQPIYCTWRLKYRPHKIGHVCASLKHAPVQKAHNFYRNILVSPSIYPPPPSQLQTTLQPNTCKLST